MSTKVYVPKDIILRIGGDYVNGFVDGTFISVERETDSFSKTVGVDGEVVRNKMHNRSGSVTFTLLQTSDMNTKLSKTLRDAESDTGSDGFFDIRIEDLNSKAVYRANSCWIRRQPNVEYANEVGGFEWVIECPNLVMVHGKDADFDVTFSASVTVEG